MTLETVLKVIDEEGFAFDIGQIRPDTKRGLEKLVRQGKLRKARAYWPWIDYGTCIKTIYGKVEDRK